MWANHVKWRKEIGADTILDDFTFEERDAFVSIYPQGYHKTDKKVRKAAVICQPASAWQHLQICGWSRLDSQWKRKTLVESWIWHAALVHDVGIFKATSAAAKDTTVQFCVLYI